MKILLEETLPIIIDGEKVAATVTIAFDGTRDSNLAQVTRRVAEGLIGTHLAPPSPLIPQNGAAPRNRFTWQRPDLHGRAMKSVHRVVRALGDAGGKGLNVADICKKARLSNVPVYKMLKDDHPQGQYAATFLRSTKVGRENVIDLTPEGRQLASQIRAGVVPA